MNLTAQEYPTTNLIPTVDLSCAKPAVANDPVLSPTVSSPAVSRIPCTNDLRIEVTTRCNYKCPVCPHDTLTRKKETMGYTLFKSIVDNVVAETDQFDTLTFPGMGEPLLDKGIVEKVAYVKSKGFKVLMITNMSMLTLEKFEALQRAGADSIRISFYGMDPKSYSEMHGVKDLTKFFKVKNELEKIVMAKTSMDILLTLNVVEGVNDHLTQEWIDHWQDKVDLLEVWRPHNWATAKTYRNLNVQQEKSCGRPFSGPLQVQVDGTVNMCCFDFDGKLLLGDLKQQSLVEVFNTPEYQHLLACHTSGNFEGSGLLCENCDQRNSDKSDVMIYNSKFNIEERVQQTSTTYSSISQDL
ncbi:MAG: SPASM domain-containing protein [Pseudomonadales bacterium]|nr:SPASM domain-containing protein [Pseudomonadales bacterium]